MGKLIALAILVAIVGAYFGYGPRPITATLADGARNDFAERHPEVASMLQEGQTLYRDVVGEPLKHQAGIATITHPLSR